MARSPRGAKSARGKKNSVRVDLSNVGEQFKAGQEYLVRCVECTLEEGTKAPYFNLKLQGALDSEFENATMYHRASTSESSLWRLRPLLEAFGIGIPDGPMDIDASDFVDHEAMCSTYLDRYEGGSSIKPDEFWAVEDGEGSGSKDADDFDLDDLDDDDIKALAEAMGVKGRVAARLKTALGKLDQDEVAEAWDELQGEGGEADAGPEGGDEFDLDELDDDGIKALAEAMDVKGRVPARLKKALAKLDQEELAEAWEELNGEETHEAPKGKAGKKDKISDDDVQEASEEELAEIIERFELDVDLDDHKTLRKMKNAVIDALEEGDHLEG